MSVGPESLSVDITFPGYEHVYGIPQHASSLSLKQTRSVLQRNMFDPQKAHFETSGEEMELTPTRTAFTTSTSSSTTRTLKWLS